MKSNYNWLLDAGHGGMRGNLYTTAPAKMYTFPDKKVIYEGVINRAITKSLYTMLMSHGVDFALLFSDVEDTPLSSRVGIANKLYARDKRCIYLSIHSNAGGGRGFEVFTSIGVTKSDTIAEYFCKQYLSEFPEYPLRMDISDGDKDKEADFYVNRKTDCPSILVENLFFDERQQAELLWSTEGQNRIAKCMCNAILKIEKEKPI